MLAIPPTTHITKLDQACSLIPRDANVPGPDSCMSIRRRFLPSLLVDGGLTQGQDCAYWSIDVLLSGATKLGSQQERGFYLPVRDAPFHLACGSLPWGF